MRVRTVLSVVLAGLLAASSISLAHADQRIDQNEAVEYRNVDDFHTDARYDVYYKQTITWSKDCFKTLGQAFECAKITAPVDWYHPEKGNFELAISRKAKAPATNTRLLLANPGGPGQPGLGFASQVIDLLKLSETHTAIDIDPRGVGDSSAKGCSGTAGANATGADGDSRNMTAEQAAGNVEYYTSMATECRSGYGELLDYMSSDQTARDFNLVRHLSGFAKADYFGISYGSVLGSHLAKEFPETIDRVVLDANVDWQAPYTQTWANLVGGTQQVFDHALLPWLARHNDKYGLGTTAAEVSATYENLRALAKDKKLDTWKPDEIDAVLFQAVYLPAGWERTGDLLARLKKQAAKGPATELADHKPTPVTGIKFSNAAYQGITCNDGAGMRDQEAWFGFVSPKLHALPLSSSLRFDAARCTTWPVAGDQHSELRDRPMKALMIQNELDPATPYWGAAHSFATVKGDVRMIVVDNAVGHGALFQKCGAAAATDYLRGGQLPQSGTCQAQPVKNDTQVYEYEDVARPGAQVTEYSERSIVDPQPISSFAGFELTEDDAVQRLVEDMVLGHSPIQARW